MPRWPTAAELAARLRPRLPLLAGVAVVVMVAGLILSTARDPEPRTLPPPSSTSSTAAPPTSAQDWSLVALPPLDGTTTTTAPRTAGFAAFRGTVTGPDGPVPGAIVVAERIVGEVVQRFEATAAGDGRYELAGIPGGRFRVRAYLPPALTMTEPEIFFQRAFETRDLDLRVDRFTGPVVRASVNPRSPIDGRGVNLAVLVAERRIGDDGIGREVPVPGIAVRVSASGWTSLDGGLTQATDGDGVALFQFRCDGTGPVSATAFVGSGSVPVTTLPDPAQAPTTTAPTLSGSFPLEVPGCSPVPTTTTTTTTTTVPDGGSDDDESGGSSTTEP